MNRLSLFVAVIVFLATRCFADEKPKPTSDQLVFKQDIVGLWLMGQSLCEGAESLPLERLRPLIAAEALYVTNMLVGDAYARAPIRYVDEADGVTVLRFENRERRDNKDFAVGQTLTTLRPFSFGNLRDSDSEKAIYRFADSAYSARVGRSYPLWNWCVLFNQLPISER